MKTNRNTANHELVEAIEVDEADEMVNNEPSKMLEPLEAPMVDTQTWNEFAELVRNSPESGTVRGNMIILTNGTILAPGAEKRLDEAQKEIYRTTIAGLSKKDSGTNPMRK